MSSRRMSAGQPVERVDEPDLVRAVQSDRRARVPDERPWASRMVHRLNDLSASSGATAAAAGLSAVFLLLALFAGHTSEWLTAFQTLAAAVTLVMVFALQHTQARHQAAVQRKLDELLRVQPGADQRLLHVESAHPAELDALAERHGGVREHALDSTTQGNEETGEPQGHNPAARAPSPDSRSHIASVHGGQRGS